MTTPEFVIDNPAQLAVLERVPGLRPPALGTLRLGGQLASHEKAGYWEVELNRNYYDCGCETGARGLLIGLLIGALLAVVAFGRGAIEYRGALAIAVAGALLGAATGKRGGVAGRRRRLSNVIREIEAAARPHGATLSNGGLANPDKHM